MEIQKLNRTCSALYVSGNDNYHYTYIYKNKKLFTIYKNKKLFTKELLCAIKNHHESISFGNIKMVIFVSNYDDLRHWFTRFITGRLWIKKLKSYNRNAHLCAVMYKNSLGNYVDENFIKI